MKTKTIEYDGGELTISISGEEIYFNGKLLHQSISKTHNAKKGFKSVCINGKTKYVSKLVALMYVPNPNNYSMVVHLDTDTFNNYYKNLVWGDMKLVAQNMQVAGRKFYDETIRGASKISYEEALKVAKRLDKGEIASHIAKEYETSDMSISRIRKRYCKNGR